MRVVMGIDGSSPSLTALQLVASTDWPAGTMVRLVGAVDTVADWTAIASPLPGGPADSDPQRMLFNTIHQLSEPLQRRGYVTETVVVRGRPADVLIAEADDLRADLVVVGNRGLGVAASALLGSVSATLVDHAPCPVLVAREPRVSRVLIATDGSRSSEAIPAVLMAWDVFRGLPIEVLCVAAPAQRMPEAAYEVDRHQVMAGEMAARLVAAGWKATGLVRRGEAAREIERAALDLGADLIITGSRGLGGLKRLLMGSVAHHVLLHSQRSVLVMRGHIFASDQASFPLGVVASA